jgi:integrase
VRWIDLNLDGIPVVIQDDMRLVPVVAVRQNVYPVKGKGLAVHGGKTATALRIVPLPELVTTRCEHGVMVTRTHNGRCAAAGRDGQPTYRWPSNVRRSVRSVGEQVGLGWMTPHTWRRMFQSCKERYGFESSFISVKAASNLSAHLIREMYGWTRLSRKSCACNRSRNACS